MAIVSKLSSGGESAAVSDRKATNFEEVYRRNFGPIWRFLKRLGVREANLDDASQDVFVVLYKKWAQFDPSRSERAWIFGIALRVASEYRKRGRRRVVVELSEQLPELRPDPAERAELSEALVLLHRLLGALSEVQREVFVLAELEQFRAPEIAELLGENLNTVYSRHRLGKKKFEEALRRHQNIKTVKEIRQ